MTFGIWTDAVTQAVAPQHIPKSLNSAFVSCCNKVVRASAELRTENIPGRPFCPGNSTRRMRPKYSDRLAATADILARSRGMKPQMGGTKSNCRLLWCETKLCSKSSTKILGTLKTFTRQAQIVRPRRSMLRLRQSARHPICSGQTQRYRVRTARARRPFPHPTSVTPRALL